MEIDVHQNILTAFTSSIRGDTKPGMWFVFHDRRLSRRVYLTVNTDYQGTFLALPVFILEVPSKQCWYKDQRWWQRFFMVGRAPRKWGKISIRHSELSASILDQDRSSWDWEFSGIIHFPSPRREVWNFCPTLKKHYGHFLRSLFHFTYVVIHTCGSTLSIVCWFCNVNDTKKNRNIYFQKDLF
jgi:hypothetical protein